MTVLRSTSLPIPSPPTPSTPLPPSSQYSLSTCSATCLAACGGYTLLACCLVACASFARASSTARCGMGASEEALARVQAREGSGSGVVRRRVWEVRKESFLVIIVGAWCVILWCVDPGWAVAGGRMEASGCVYGIGSVGSFGVLGWRREGASHFRGLVGR